MFVDGDPHFLERRYTTQAIYMPVMPQHPLANVTTAAGLADTSDTHEPLGINKDNLRPSELDLSDPTVKIIAEIFVSHNIVRRNLLSCASNARAIDPGNADAFCYYATHTTLVLEEQLEISDMIWFPAFTEYEGDFYNQIKAHWRLKTKAAELRGLIPPANQGIELAPKRLEMIATKFEELYELVNAAYDKEEIFLNRLGHRVPIRALEHLYKQQAARRTKFVHSHGQMWSGLFLARSLHPEETEIMPPSLPRLVANGMIAAASLQFKKAISFAPKRSPSE